MTDVVARHVLVSGRVQGVAYRYSTVSQAQRAGVTGWVRNLTDGRVEAWLEGPAEEVERMLAWMRTGPPAARVEHTLVREEPPSGATSFRTRSTSPG